MEPAGLHATACEQCLHFTFSLGSATKGGGRGGASAITFVSAITTVGGSETDGAVTATLSAAEEDTDIAVSTGAGSLSKHSTQISQRQA